MSGCKEEGVRDAGSVSGPGMDGMVGTFGTPGTRGIDGMEGMPGMDGTLGDGDGGTRVIVTPGVTVTVAVGDRVPLRVLVGVVDGVRVNVTVRDAVSVGVPVGVTISTSGPCTHPPLPPMRSTPTEEAVAPGIFAANASGDATS